MLTCSKCTGTVSVEDTECPYCGFEFKVRKPWKPRQNPPTEQITAPATTYDWRTSERRRGVHASLSDSLGAFDFS